ncbi:MAG: hypothetical protein HDR35_03330 [Treponema sp.]|nr:hypothetical protein [Treponema sp.]
MKTTEQQTLEFITFCTEMYAGKKNISDNEFLIPMIDEFLETRSKSP